MVPTVCKHRLVGIPHIGLDRTEGMVVKGNNEGERWYLKQEPAERFRPIFFVT